MLRSIAHSMSEAAISTRVAIGRPFKRAANSAGFKRSPSMP